MKTLLLLLFVLNTQAQNIVGNGSFETYTAIPTGTGQITEAIGWTSAGKSPDYLHEYATIFSGMNIPQSVFGTLQQTDGLACAGICNYLDGWYDYHEFLSYKLDSPMIAGQWYSVKVNTLTALNPVYYGGIVANGFGIAFSKKKLNNPIGIVPQCLYLNELYSATWTTLSFVMYADSNYKFITLGNFITDSLQTRHLIDSTALVPCSYLFLDNVSVEVITGLGIEEHDKSALKREIYYNLLGQKIK